MIALSLWAISSVPALAAPQLQQTACPAIRTADGKVDTSPLAAKLSAATSYVPAPLFGGGLYCSLGIRASGGGMFSAGTPHALLHERGKIEDIAYRIDYHRSWVEVYLDDGATSYAPTKVSGRNAHEPHFLCRFDIVDGDYSDVTHRAGSEVVCAQLPRPDRDIIFWFSAASNGVAVSKTILYDSVDGESKYIATDALPLPDPLPERMDGRECSFFDTMLAIPGVPGALCFKPRDSLAMLGFSPAYHELFGPLRTQGLTYQGYGDERELMASPAVGTFIGKMAGKDYFLVGGMSRNRAEYVRVPTARLFRSLALLGPIAERMIEEGR